MTDKLQLVSILDQSLNSKVLQGSVATCLRCDGIFSDHFVTQSSPGSGYDGGKILKIGQLCRSYGQESSVLFFGFFAFPNRQRNLLEDVVRRTNLITTSFAQDKIQIRLTLAL